MLIGISFIFCMLFIRLGVVQLINGKGLQVRAEEQWTRDLPLIAERGKILDASGASLAVSFTTYNVYVRARQLEDSVQTAKFLAEILNMSYSDVYDKVLNTSVSEVLIKAQVESEVAQKVIDRQIKGIYLSENIKRYYPYGNLLTQILGFTTVDNVGQAGIELYYDNYLKGIDGITLVQSDLTGNEIDNTLRTYIPAVKGMDISLTIDSKIQLIVEKTLEKLMVEQESKSASCIIMNPNTFEILAMSTKPSFDLNNVPRNDISLLMDMVKNKSVVDVYEPGSTFKVLTMATVLEENLASIDTGFYCGGSCLVDGEKIKCWKSVGHGSQDLTDGLCNSCNCVFVDLALRIGTEKFYEYLSMYGFGTPTGVEIAGESSGIIMNKKSVKSVDLARMGFGQAVAVTPLQQICAISSVVNGGILYQPQLIKQINSADSQVYYKNDLTQVRRVVSAETSNRINIMLEEVVSKTGKYTFIPGYEVGGKTGTTQKYENGKISGKYIASFIGTFPVKNPEYVILLTVDEPGTGQYYGSIVASPYAKEILQGIFEYKNIAPQHEVDGIITEYNILMPELIGKSLTEACNELIKLGINYEIAGDGGVVVSQLPYSNAVINKTTTVVLTTE